MNKEAFENFEEGYYKYKGELIYIAKEPNQLILKDLNVAKTDDGATIGGEILYGDFERDKEKINFNLLIKTDPLDYLKKKNIQIIDFIQGIEKEKKKRLEQIAQT